MKNNFTPPTYYPTNCELRHFGQAKHFLIPPAQRPAWFAGIVGAIVLLGLWSWTDARDDAAQLAEARTRHDPLARMVATTHCAPPDAPLERLVLTIGSEADGNPPTIACVYITADLGTIPRLRYERPLQHAASAQ